jgi:hypothetical protein
MRFTKSTRLIALATLAGSLTAGTLAMSGSAYAAAEKSITCKTLTGPDASGNIVISKCNGNTGGSTVSFPFATLASGGVVTWTNGKTTTFGTVTTGTGKKTAKCATTPITFKATVSADTTGLTKLGTSTGEVCVAASGAFSFVKPMKIT